MSRTTSDDANEHIGRSRQLECPTDHQAMDRAAKRSRYQEGAELVVRPAKRRAAASTTPKGWRGWCRPSTAGAREGRPQYRKSTPLL